MIWKIKKLIQIIVKTLIKCEITLYASYKVVSALIILTSWVALIQAEKPISFHSQVIEIKDTTINNLVISPDLDKNGLPELIIQQERKLVIYQANFEKKETNLKQISDFLLPDDIFLYDFAPISGHIWGLLGITPEGVKGYLFQNGRFHKEPVLLLKVETIFKGNLSSPPLYRKLFYYPYLIIPGNQKFIVGKITPNGNYLVFQEIAIKLTSRIDIGLNLAQPVQSLVSVPLFYLTDINQDGKIDLVFYHLGRNDLDIYLGGEKFSRLNSSPINLSLTQKRKDKAEYHILPIIKDINGDMYPDCLISNGSEGITGVYLNHGGSQQLQQENFYRSNQPDYLKRYKGWLINHSLEDLNNDGAQDLISILMYKVGVISGLKLLLARSVNWEIEIYLAQKGSKERRNIYPDSPSWRKTINMPFNLSLSPEDIKVQMPYLISFSGDFNQDKLLDFIIKDPNQNNLQIYFGDKKTIFSTSPKLILPLASGKDFISPDLLDSVPKITDLNGDGLQDILIHQTDFVSRNHIIEIFYLSK